MIDSHCHLHHARYDADRQSVIQAAHQAGVAQMMVIGCDLADSEKAVQLAESTPNLFASVGVHPHEAAGFPESDLARLAELAQHPKVLAIGEMGLDFYYDHSPRETQKHVFAQQLQLANQLDKPVVIHSRDAEEESLAEIKNCHPVYGGQVHCFTGSLAFAKSLLAMDFYLGFTGIITFKNAHELQEVVKITPLERILIETDSPYLAPIPFRGKRNEPAFLPAIAEKVAELKNESLQTVIQATTENFERLYHIKRN